ncbi:MAG TPA: hypothetical protein VHM90_08015, partial [Phycisphaerae bacterium]|nr:hypothetical protein [Phycisphaerae bacterium]
MHSLSTRHGFPILVIFEKSHSLSLLACGGGGGGFSTVTWVDAEVLKPRESEQLAVTVTVPGEAPVVFRVAVLPLPETLPLLAVQPLTVTGTLSGLLQVQEILDVPPVCNEVG